MDRHREAAEQALGVVGALAGRVPRFIGWGLAVAEAALDGPREVAVVGPAGDAGRAALHRVALLGTAPGAVVAVGAPGSDEYALLADRPLLGDRPAAYVCRHFVCAAPTADPEALGSSSARAERSRCRASAACSPGGLPRHVRSKGSLMTICRGDFMGNALVRGVPVRR